MYCFRSDDPVEVGHPLLVWDRAAAAAAPAKVVTRMAQVLAQVVAAESTDNGIDIAVALVRVVT